MSWLEGIEGLRGLQQDLIALDESRLRNVDRLWVQLEARIDEFRHLLDRSRKNEQSRKQLLSGTNPSSDHAVETIANRKALGKAICGLTDKNTP